MRKWIIPLLLASASCGCTMAALQRETHHQSTTLNDLRYREIVHNLARVASDPSALPCYATIYTGGAQVSDTQTMISTTVLQHVARQNGYGSQMISPSLQRQVNETWTLDPIIFPEKLEALRACLRWVILGPESLSAEEMSLLVSPDDAPVGPKRHFDVAAALSQLPKGWLRVGALCDVPAHACYKAQCGSTSVWVEPDGKKGLADFTLIIQKIGRVDINSPTLFHFPPTNSYLNVSMLDSSTAKNDEREVRVTAQVYADPNGRLQPDTPYFALRLTDANALSHLRSNINLAVPTPK